MVEQQIQNCSISHLSLIVKGYLMITMHPKTFGKKGASFVDHLGLCVAVFKLLFFIFN